MVFKSIELLSTCVAKSTSNSMEIGTGHFMLINALVKDMHAQLLKAVLKSHVLSVTGVAGICMFME